LKLARLHERRVAAPASDHSRTKATSNGKDLFPSLK
jgi:hypothetical protein